MKAHILYVEDDQSLSFVTRDNLELQGYQLTCCHDGQEALAVISGADFLFDLCILDVMLPHVDGYTLASEIRRRDPAVPIIFLTAKSLKEDRIQGLKLGADDYLTKPFSMEELQLKIEIFLRRRHVVSDPLPALTKLGTLVFDHENLLLQDARGDERRLTQKEADLLRYLLEHKNQVVRRSTILEELWGEDDYFLGRSLDVFISRLRKYVRPDNRLRIDTIHGVGFQLVCPD
ncbi:MAG: response regulator transcription factor [Lewinellaceae bacterium]|nr:response regulator transcription factor [Lewinellaceae bacterium]